MRQWSRRWGVVLGSLAVAVSLYLPIHIAADIVHAAMHARDAAARQAGRVPIVAQRDIPAHHHHDHSGGQRQGDNLCPVCASVSAAVTATIFTTPVTIALPSAIAHATDPVATARLKSLAEWHPYQSRAPPTLS